MAAFPTRRPASLSRFLIGPRCLGQQGFQRELKEKLRKNVGTAFLDNKSWLLFFFLTVFYSFQILYNRCILIFHIKRQVNTKY